jgi:hypothetical protein
MKFKYLGHNISCCSLQRCYALMSSKLNLLLVLVTTAHSNILPLFTWLLLDTRDGSRRGAPGTPPPPKTGKNMIFWRKIVIFHTKYPNNFRSSLRNWKKIWIFGVKSWFFTRNTPKLFAPPSARRNFFKCAPPLTWNPGSAPGYMWGYA